MRLGFAVLGLIVATCGGCLSFQTGGARGHVRLGLWHDLSQPSRDPDPTRPLGEDLTASPPAREDQSSAADEASTRRSELMSGVFGSVLLWLAGGGVAAQAQVVGSFDEVEIVAHVAHALGLGRTSKR